MNKRGIRVDEYAEIYERIRRGDAAWNDWKREHEFAQRADSEAAITWMLIRTDDYLRSAQE
jgi:hypothetical protein